MRDRRLDRHTWTELADRIGTVLLAVPVGSVEQHGPHLPLGTDSDVADHLAAGLASHRDDVLVAPPIAYGSSGEHAAFPGTLSIGGPALTTLVVELVRSADAFRGVVLVSGHGGNLDALRAAVSQLHDEGRSVLLWAPSVRGGDAHAGRTETSMMLVLDPGRAPELLGQAAVGNVQPLGDLLPAMRAGGVAAVSPNGVLGDPTGASPEEGSTILDRLVADLVAAVGTWAP